LRFSVLPDAESNTPTGNLFRPGLRVGCTIAHHRLIGVHIQINARAGELWRNDDSLDEIEMKRDAEKVRRWRAHRIAFYQFASRWFRKHLSHILEEIGERERD
jgi:hypothetical protein